MPQFLISTLNPQQAVLKVRNCSALCLTLADQEGKRHSSLEIYHFRATYAFVLEKAMAPHSSALAWRIPWTEEPGRLQSMGSLRV